MRNQSRKILAYSSLVAPVIAHFDVGLPIAVRVKQIEEWLKDRPSRWEKDGEWFRINAPYLFQKLSGGRWLALNREYKPLGLPRAVWANYEEFAYRAHYFHGDPADYQDIWTAGSSAQRAFWLYNDDMRSTDDYFSRLLKLDGYIVQVK